MQIENWETFFFIFLFLSFSLSLVLALLVVVPLHISLCKNLDPLLFKEPYFKKQELGIFNTWPLSIVKSTSYMLLIVKPRLVHKRFSTLTLKINPACFQFYGSVVCLSAVVIAFGSLCALGGWLLIDSMMEL
jgi:hypothetical protein